MGKLSNNSKRTQLANKHMKNYALILIVRKTQSNPERCYFIPLQWLLLKTKCHKIENNEPCRKCGPHALIVGAESCSTNVESSTKC